jgi:hypothetical protein
VKFVDFCSFNDYLLFDNSRLRRDVRVSMILTVGRYLGVTFVETAAHFLAELRLILGLKH